MSNVIERRGLDYRRTIMSSKTNARVARLTLALDALEAASGGRRNFFDLPVPDHWMPQGEYYGGLALPPAGGEQESFGDEYEGDGYQDNRGYNGEDPNQMWDI